MLHQFLPNGVEVVLKENHFAKMVAVQCWVGVGSIHEKDTEAGMSHLIEHMLFKGTTQRAVGEISRTVEACGGDINAYTTFDRTVFYLTLSSRHAQTGVDLLADAVLHSTFDATELEREKQVILEEIRRGHDNPGNKVGRRIFETIYAGTPAARPIIGFENQVAAYTRDDVVSFYRRWYQPSNFTVVAVGDFDSEQMFQWISKYFGEQGAGKPVQPALPERRDLDKIHVHLVKGDYKQPRLEIAYCAPVLESADTPSLDLAAFALGAGDASRLNRKLRDRDGIVSSVGCSLYSPRFGGVFELSAFTTEGLYLDAVKGLALELSNLKFQEPVSLVELERARANLRADRVYQEETVGGQARALGMGLTTSHKTLYDEVYTTLIEHTTPSHIQEAIHRWVKDDAAVIVGLLPEDSKITEDEVRQAYVEGFASGRAHPRAPALLNLSRERSEKASKPEVVKLASGATLVYRQNLNSGLFNLTAATEGGLRAEDERSVGLHYALAELLGTSTSSKSYEDVLHLVEGTGAVLQGFSGKDSFGLKLQCLTEQADGLISLWADVFLNARFPAEQWERAKREIRETIDGENDSPFKIGARCFQETIFGNHPYRWPLYGTEKNVESFSLHQLEEAYRGIRDSGSWVFGCVTSLPRDTIVTLLNVKLANWKASTAPRDLNGKLSLMGAFQPETITISKQREQTHILTGGRGLTWSDKDRAALDILGTILGGSGGRLFLKLRDEESLAYTVTPMISYGCHPGIVGAYIACAPEKKERALAALERELTAIWKEPVSADELSRAQNYLLGSHEAELQRGDSQAMTMALMEVYRIGHDDFLNYPERLLKVTREDVQRAAECLLRDGARLTVLVGP